MGSSRGFLHLTFFYLFIFVISLFYPIHDAFARVDRLERGEEEIRPFALRELSGALDLRFEYEDDQDKGLGEPFQQKQTCFEERLDLRGRGSIYHPNLLEFNLNTSFGLRQELFRGDFKDNSNSYPYDYDANLNFLRQKPYTFNLFASRSSDRVSRQFFEPIKIDSNFYGGTFRYRNKLFPMGLFLQSSNTEEDSSDFKRNREEKTADFRISNRLGEILKSELNYIYKNTIEETPDKQELTNNNFYLNSTFEYKQTRGISNISYLKNNGVLSTDQLQVNENVYVDHSKTFTTLYNYNLNYFVAKQFRSTANRGSVGFRHKLYESLVTEVKGEVSLTEATDFKETFYGPSVFLSYRKKVPGGIFSAGYNFLYRRTDRDAEAGIDKVFGEQIVLSDAQRTFLANPEVVLSSVIVRDTFGAILTLDVDYRLIPSGNLTEIQRVVLPDNTTVFVDYDFVVPRSLKYDTLSNGVNLRYGFKQLFTLYYNYLNTTQKEISRVTGPRETSLLNDTLRSLYGAELRWRWFNITGEYEDDRSDLNPFLAHRIRGNFNISPTDYSLLGLSASHGRTEYEKDRRTVTYDNAEAVLNLRPYYFLEAVLSVGFLKEKGTDVDTRAWRFKGDLKSRYRSLELKLETEYLNRKELTQTRDEFLVKIKLIRYFNIL